MAEPIETVIIHAQQNFEIAGGLNLVQTEIEDDRVLKNDTEQIFITCRELNDVKIPNKQ